ncbi:MAG: ATP-binding protein [Vicinamibacterales bacterium]
MTWRGQVPAIERHETVLIQGPAGVGKSHLAQALGHEACRRGFDVVFVSAARMLGHLHGGRADGTYERRLLIYTRPDLLILDDFGLKPLPPAGPEDFLEVINERYEHGALIVTSNRAFTEWPEVFQSPLLASATLDRLAHHAHQIVITGDSFRANGRRRGGPRERPAYGSCRRHGTRHRPACPTAPWKTAQSAVSHRLPPLVMEDEIKPGAAADEAVPIGPRSPENDWPPTGEI